MKLDQLLYFVETARFEHIGKAAKALAISPSAVSHAITNLEEELGRPLFLKKGKNIFLTPHGKELATKAKAILSEVDHLKSHFEAESNELQGHFRLAATHLLSSSLLATAWAKLTQKRPLLTCEIYSLRSAQVVSGIAASEFDFGVCFSPQSHPDLESKVIKSGQLRIAFRKGHPLAKKARNSWLKEIAHFSSAMPKAFHGIDVCERHPTLAKHGLAGKNTFIYDSYETAIAYLQKSDGWGFLPDWVIEQTNLVSPVHPSDWKAPYTISAVWPRTRPMSKALEMLLSQFPV